MLLFRSRIALMEKLDIANGFCNKLQSIPAKEVYNIVTVHCALLNISVSKIVSELLSEVVCEFVVSEL